MKQEALKESEGKRVICATFALAAEGLDIRGLNTLILASPKSDIEQSVGRILRDKDRRIHPVVVDIADNFSMFERQSQKRLQFYKKQGYSVAHGGACDDV
eukprot:jgi/Chrzof1/7989/UNPLg00040.t1